MARGSDQLRLCIYGALICLSLFLQQARHELALSTGLLILPMSLAVGAGSLASGPLTARVGSKQPMLAGFGLAAVGAALLALTSASTSLALIGPAVAKRWPRCGVIRRMGSYDLG